MSLPPLSEQKAIASVLGALDDKIDLNRRMCKTLETMAQALFKSWFVDFDPVCAKMRGEQPYGMDAATAALFPDKLVESELGLIPEGWGIQSLSGLFIFQKGKKSDVVSFSPHEGFIPLILILTLDGQSSGYVSPEKQIIVDQDDLLMVMDGASSGRLETGLCGVVGSTLSKLHFKDRIYSSIVFSFLKCHENEIKNNTTGTSIPHTDKNKVLNYKIVLPSKELISLFNQIRQKILAKNNKNRSENIKLEKTRDYLLPKLISGEMKTVRSQ